jgi:hypothetical protein
MEYDKALIDHRARSRPYERRGESQAMGLQRHILLGCRRLSAPVVVGSGHVVGPDPNG